MEAPDGEMENALPLLLSSSSIGLDLFAENRMSSQITKRSSENGHRGWCLKACLEPPQIDGGRSIKCLERVAPSDDCALNERSGPVGGSWRASQPMRNIENRSLSVSYVFLARSWSQSSSSSPSLLLFGGGREQLLRRISILLSLLLIIFGPLLLVLLCAPVSQAQMLTQEETTSANSTAATTTTTTTTTTATATATATATTTTAFIGSSNKHRFKSSDDIRSAGAPSGDAVGSGPAFAELATPLVINVEAAAAGVGSQPEVEAEAKAKAKAEAAVALAIAAAYSATAATAAQNGDDNQSTNQSNSSTRIGSKIRSKRRSRRRRRRAIGEETRSSELLAFLDLEQLRPTDSPSVLPLPPSPSPSPNTGVALNKCNSSSSSSSCAPTKLATQSASSTSTSAANRSRKLPSASHTSPTKPAAMRAEPPVDRDLIAGQASRVQRQVGTPTDLTTLRMDGGGEEDDDDDDDDEVEQEQHEEALLGHQRALDGGDGGKHLAVGHHQHHHRHNHQQLDGLSNKLHDNDESLASAKGFNCNHMVASSSQLKQARAESGRLPPADSNHDHGDGIKTHHNLIASNDYQQQPKWLLDDEDEDTFLDANWLRRRRHSKWQLDGGRDGDGDGDGNEQPENGYNGLIERYKRRAGSDKMQTIYFGGFFPWLTDEESGSSLATYDNLERANDAEPSPLSSSPSAGYPLVVDDEYNELPVSRSKKQGTVKRRKQQPNGSSNIDYNTASNLPLTSSATSFSSENRHQLGRFILPAVRLALDHINKNNSVLSSYKLEIVPRDTQCNATISLKEFFDMVYEEPKKMLLYGDACRVSTDPIAKASYFFDLIQISYADTDPIYTIENYPNFFRVVPSENALSLARIPFIRHFNWTRVGTIYQNLPRYSLPHSKLLTDLERFNIVIKQSVSLPGSVDGLQNRDLGDELRKLKEKDVRIILGNFDEEWALLLFCEAFREKMTGRKYQWILTGVSENKLWQFYKSKGSPCTEQELLIAMDGYIITDITPVTRAQHRTISGMMAHEYSNEYKRRAREMNISIDENKFYGYVYDGIWAIALALNRVDSKLKYYSWLAESGKAKLKPELEGLTSLLDFDYHRPIWVKLIREALNKTRFNGVTGTVTFHKNERPGLISFSQFQAFRDMNEVIIGSYDALNDSLDLKVGFPIYWRGPSPPIDYTIQRLTPFRINRTLFVIISIMALFGILLAIIFLTINIKFRNQRYIKMSSPYLNNLIIIGCILTYTSVIILGLDSGLTSEYNFPYICNARAWVLMAGFTLAFGSMFSKTFRVHSIFTNIKLHKKVIKDYKLFMVVFILLTFDVCILIVWQYFDPFYRETNNGTSIQDSDNEDVIIVPEMEHCQSKRMTIFLSVIYVYKGLLMAFGCFLAWETRHVSIPALNDSKYIGLSVYNVVIMCVIGASLSFVLRDQQDASFVIISIFIIFCSTTTLCLVFVPKLIELKQNPRAGDHRVRATLKTFKKNYHEEALGAAAGCRDIHGNIIGRGFNVNLNDRIKIMLDENIKQRSTLKEKTYELEALTYKYRKIQNMIQSGQYLQALNSTAAPSPTSLAPLPSSDTANNLVPNLMTQKTAPYSILKESKPSTKGLEIPPAKENNNGDNKFGLFKSAMMSSTTQLTTTNTTSSTNNTTDLTNDYSSSKMMSTATTSTNSYTTGTASGIGKRAFVAFNCALNDEGPSSTERHTAFNLNADGDRCPIQEKPINLKGKESLILSTGRDQSKKTCQAASKPVGKHLHKYTTDSSYCSMGVDYDVCDRPRKSQDDLDLFTVFSYTSNRNNNQNRRMNKQTRSERAGNNFSRWSEGPFCVLMVRKNDHLHMGKNHSHGISSRTDQVGPGEAILKATDSCQVEDESQLTGGGRRVDDETRASCPNIADKLGEAVRRRTSRDENVQLQRMRKYLSQQSDECETKNSSGQRSSRLPRTISMIEYLGLNEFDMIARRHDKLQRRKLIRKQPSYCYESQLCSCCASGPHFGASHQVVKQGIKMRCNSQSDGDFAFSSSDLLNSGADLAHTSSHLSCSTCCSLGSPTFASHSQITDDTTSQSVSTPTMTSISNESNNNHNHHYPSNSQSSTSSSSIVDQENSHRLHFCHHHQQQHQQQQHHQAQHFYGLQRQHAHSTNINTSGPNSNQHPQYQRHHHQQHNHPLGEPNSTASSVSSIYKNNNQSKSTAHSDEHPMCTSGLLYQGPTPKEAANDTAQPVAGALATAADPVSLSAITTIEDCTEDDEAPEKLLIKCDVLESL